MKTTLDGISIPDNVNVINRVGKMPLKVQADSVQLGRVFTTLVVNANEAMINGGELTLTAVILGQDAEVTFADSGPGMGPEELELEKIFEPLYTTKIQGTGLGLAVCQQVLAKHNGWMSVHSKPGVGTTFTVRLPLITKEALSA